MSVISNKHYNASCFIIAFCFFLVSGGAVLIYSKLWGVSGRSGGNALFQLVSISIYGWALVKLLTVYRYKAIAIVSRSLPLFVLIVLCIVSTLWSVEPFTTFRRSMALFLTYCFCLYLVARYDARELLFIAFLVCVFIAFFGSIAVVIPGWGIDGLNYTYSNAVRGLAGHKNDFGRYMAIGILLCWYLFYSREISRILFIGVTFIFSILLLLSESKTPLAVLVLVIFLSPLANMYVMGKFNIRDMKHYSVKFRILVFAVVTPIIISLILYMLSYILEILGKDVTLTGRTYIWEYALDFGERHKWLGSGYRSFWVDGWGTYTFWGTDRTIRNGHSGFIDVYLEMGYLGFAAFVFFIVSYFRFCMLPSMLINSTISVRVYSLLLLVFYLCYSVTEQMTLKQSELMWMLLMVFYMLISKKRVIKVTHQ